MPGTTQIDVTYCLSDGRLDDGRPGQSNGPGLDHDSEVRRRRMQGRVAIGRAKHRRCARDRWLLRPRAEEGLEIKGQSTEPPTHDVWHPAAIRVTEQDDRIAEALRLIDDSALLAHTDRRGRSGEHARVDSHHTDRPAVDATESGHDPIAGDAPLKSAFRLGQQSEFKPRVGVEELLK